MTYVIVTIKSVLDREALKQYAEKVAPTVERHGGKYLAMEPNPEIKAGEWPFGRTILIGFPSFEAAQNWYGSPEYQEIVPIRLKAFDANIAFIRDVSETAAAEKAASK